MKGDFMSQSPIASAAAFALASLFAIGAGTAQAGHRSRNVTIDDGDNATDCRRINIRFDGLATTARGEEEMSLPDRGQPVRVHAARNGGVRVVGWDRPEYSVKACKAAGGEDAGAADAALKKVALSIGGDEIGVTGPGDDSDWNAFLIIHAPKKASLDLSASNGPVSLRDVGGKLTVKTVNGPVSLAGCTGDVRVDAVNGPVSVAEGAGDMKVSATNGPLTVTLGSNRWDGAGLDARTTNGPLTLKMPDNYDSGVVVEASSHSPIRCKAAPSDTARREGDEFSPRRLQMGSGSTVVHLSTTNGPVSIVTRN
jgi:hypothetical protein